jgi:hypothetical protein
MASRRSSETYTSFLPEISLRPKRFPIS